MRTLSLLALLFVGQLAAAELPVAKTLPVAEVTFAKNPTDACVSVWRGNSGGSGTCVATDGKKSLVLSNNHVVSPGHDDNGYYIEQYPQTVIVKHKDKDYKGVAIAGNQPLDVCVIEVEGILPVARLAMEAPKPGTKVVRNGIGAGWQEATVIPHDPTYVTPSMHFWVTGYTISGDSGSAYFDSDGKMVALHCGRAGGETPRGTPIGPVRKFLEKRLDKQWVTIALAPQEGSAPPVPAPKAPAPKALPQAAPPDCANGKCYTNPYNRPSVKRR